MEQESRISYSKLGVLSIAHLFNDMYGNFMPQLNLFLAVAITGFTKTQASVLVSTFTFTSSLVQPLFGFFLDRQGKRWLVHVGTLWMGVMLGLTGLVNSYGLLVILAALAGLGTAAFHPQAATMVNVLSGDRKGVILSVFIAFGNFGFALSPLLLVPLFQAFGLHATIYTIIPGVIVAILLLFTAPKNEAIRGTDTPLSEIMATLKASSRELLAILGVIAVRSMAYQSMITLLPFYLKGQSMSNVAASQLMTIMLGTGAIGGVLGGLISDRFGRKKLIVGSLFVATPLFFGFFLLKGFISIVFLALAGAALLSNMSVGIVAAQEAIPNNKALASGLTMGFSGGVGSILAISLGKVADTWGNSAALTISFLLPLAAGAIGLLMKSRPSDRAQRLQKAS